MSKHPILSSYQFALANGWISNASDDTLHVIHEYNYTEHKINGIIAGGEVMV